MLAGVREIGQLGPARAQLFSDLAPGLAGMGAVGLIESLTDRGGDDGVLAAGDVREGVPDPVNAATLPVASKTRAMAALRPVWASLMTSLTPPRPRARRELRNSVQNVSASDGPMPRPMISRRPSVLAATAIMAATIRPTCRTLR